MEALYHKTNKLVQVTQGCFERLEVCTDKEAESLEKEIQARIDTITSNCEKLDILAFKEPLAKRQIAKTRVSQLKHDNQYLQAALRGFQHKRYKQELELQERDELLSRRFTSIRDEETSIMIDHSLQHMNSLQRANRNLDEIIYTGTSVLENLREQRVTLKGAQKKLMDFANTLGLSNTTMRLIENRVKEDKWILIGGMILTMVIVFVLIIYFR
ncbi:UNVERIFIED_CONTAM: hypothetical protein PYX00_002175 [Menopon gallinae]|uniref:Golgi SNAP receptor complex member 2 n=1 Tax=Menopon gallinae TaxID=328185 RepID=A0AAW2IGQ7_9NEOP